ncbi:hypothetical protein MHU86_24037 [Fragilaria crotonensis]|nr:hypothetical protein MHU86_24037 [Fragilaria crotonensis]
MHLEISDLHLDPLHGPKDEYIMQSEHLKRYTPAQQQDLNLVRLWLQVATLADMCDPDHPNRILLCYSTAVARMILRLRPSGLDRPNHQKPNSDYGNGSFVRLTFAIRPIGKSPGKCPTPSATTASPQSFPEDFSYISSLPSRTERRL